jgi:hypothetical protein
VSVLVLYIFHIHPLRTKLRNWHVCLLFLKFVRKRVYSNNIMESTRVYFQILYKPSPRYHHRSCRQYLEVQRASSFVFSEIREGEISNSHNTTSKQSKDLLFSSATCCDYQVSHPSKFKNILKKTA